MTGYVYGLHNGDENIRYVGSTLDPRRRLNEHRSQAHIEKVANRKNGAELAQWLADNNPVTMTILEETPSEGRALAEKEADWTRRLSGLFNTHYGWETLRGENHPWWGRKHTVEWRQEQSEKVRGEKHPMFGRKHTPETIALYTEQRSGTKNPNALFSEQEVRYYRGKWAEGKSIRALAEEAGVVHSTMNRLVKGQTYKEVAS